MGPDQCCLKPTKTADINIKGGTKVHILLNLLKGWPIMSAHRARTLGRSEPKKADFWPNRPKSGNTGYGSELSERYVDIICGTNRAMIWISRLVSQILLKRVILFEYFVWFVPYLVSYLCPFFVYGSEVNAPTVMLSCNSFFISLFHFLLQFMF
jgi:hypothetical protein